MYIIDPWPQQPLPFLASATITMPGEASANFQQKVMCRSGVLTAPAYLIADTQEAKAEIEKV